MMARENKQKTLRREREAMRRAHWQSSALWDSLSDEWKAVLIEDARNLMHGSPLMPAAAPDGDEGRTEDGR